MDINLGHYLKVSGAGKTRAFWVKEVGHARVLKMMDFGEIDGGLGCECAGDGLVERETTLAGAPVVAFLKQVVLLTVLGLWVALVRSAWLIERDEV